MTGQELVVRMAVSPAGNVIDRWCVRYLDQSPVSWLFARAAGVEYNRPLLLTAIGRKSGQRRSVVLPHFAAGDGKLAVVGSRGGAPTDPHWARNLRANGDASIHMQRREIAVKVHVAQGAERESLWKSITERAPIYLEYQERAREQREIPVFVIERADGQPPADRLA